MSRASLHAWLVIVMPSGTPSLVNPVWNTKAGKPLKAENNEYDIHPGPGLTPSFNGAWFEGG